MIGVLGVRLPGKQAGVGFSTPGGPLPDVAPGEEAVYTTQEARSQRREVKGLVPG